jgi:tetratricopeptide (TPR) repeat protein
MKHFILCVFCICTAKLYADDAFGSLAERYRNDAARAQAANRNVDARNAWYKYLAVRTMDLKNFPLEERQAVEQSIVMLTPVPVIAVEKTVNPEKTVPTLRSMKADMRNLFIDPLMTKAGLLRRNGQYDAAMRLYQLVLEKDPENKAAKSAMADLKKEMN